jgi:uncharacterized protein (TIGR02246 family)
MSLDCAQKSSAKDKAGIMLAHQRGIAAVLVHYEVALNASNTDGVMPLYAEDGVFMPPFSASAVGTAAVRQAYDSVFKAIRLSVKFDVAEVVQMAPDWAFARTNSTGTVIVNATGVKNAERTKNYLFSQELTMARGRSRATASPPSIHRTHKD